MTRFLKQLLVLALVPAALCVSLCGLILWHSGELAGPQAVVERTLSESDVISELNFWGNDYTTWYKTYMTKHHKASVLVLGNSRVMQIRECMMPGADFYNAGGAIAYLSHYSSFLNGLSDDELPEVLVLTLDSYFFIYQWNYREEAEKDWTAAYTEIDPLHALTIVARRIGSGAIKPLQILRSDKRYIGLPACARGSGFSADGSYNYGTSAEQIDLTFMDSMGRMTVGGTRFERADYIDWDTMSQLDQLLTLCDEKGIQVVAFMPPYAPTVYHAMVDSGWYGYLDYAFPAVSEIFAAHPGHVVFDFTYMPDTTDEMYLDGFHGGDVVYAMMLKQMVQAGVLTDYTSVEILDELIASARNPRVIDPPAA
ncbi:MAG: hypothetical protein IJ347_08395 [Faecalibacterium sp.]|nr:hypothetical protein [Faecalibacterium sp.]